MANDVAYRGYLIRRSPMRSDVWVEHDGFVIVRSVQDVAHARALIDDLLSLSSEALDAGSAVYEREVRRG